MAGRLAAAVTGQGRR